MTQSESDDLRGNPGDERLFSMMDSLTSEDFDLVDPPEGLWDSIAERVRADQVEAPAPVVDAPPVVLSDRRASRVLRGRSAVLLAAAAAVVVIGIGAAIVANSGPGPERLIAKAQLEQLEPLGKTAASARLVDEDGSKHLIIDARNMAAAPAGSQYELWLIDPEVTKPRSLGVVTGSGDIRIPPSINPRDYPIVDISLEPIDGDSSHSGHSLMRGSLF